MSIIDIANKNPLFQTSVVELFETRDRLAEGVLRTAGGDYDVAVHRDKGRASVMVTILPEIEDEGRRREAALRFARLALADPSTWGPVAVDTADGEVVYHIDCISEVSSRALDRALERAREFIEAHGGEVRGAVFESGGAPASDFDLEDLF